MFRWSMLWFACSALFWGMSYRLIEGYSQPGFTRPTDYDDDGNAFEGGVWNDWWPALVLLAVLFLIPAVGCMILWVNDRKAFDHDDAKDFHDIADYL